MSVERLLRCKYILCSFIQGLVLKALNNITKTAVTFRGPLFILRYPSKTTVSETILKLDEISQGSHRKLSNQRFPLKIVKLKSKRRFSNNSSSLSDYADILPFSWDINALELKLNQSLPWPLGSFSLAFWLYIDGGRLHLERDARSTRARYGKPVPGGKNKTKDITHVVHVISFGTKTAWFEVWVDLLKATLICRYMGMLD